MNHPADMEDCIELAERLSEYIDDELPPELRAQVERHFEGCADCARFLYSLTRIKELGHLLPPDSPPPERLRRLAEEARKRTDG